MGSKPTIRDVAKKAGVSVATVSYVLNDNKDETISEQAKRRVWDAVRALNYHRAAAAVGLARQKTRNLGIVLYQDDSALTNPFYSFVIQGVIREAMDRDYNLLFSYLESRYRGNQDLPKIVREANVAGILFVCHVYPRMLRDIRDAGIPVVAIDNYPAIRGISSVQIDNRAGGALAADHLIALGHERVAVVGSVVERPSIVERCQGFVGAVEERGLPFAADSDVVACDSLGFEQGYARSLYYLQNHRKVTGLFCANDEVAAGVLRACHELGRTVPEEVSVVGFDDIIMANYTDPPLTTIGVDKEQLGRRATALLVDHVEGRSSSAVEETVSVKLVTRDSTCPRRLDKKGVRLQTGRSSGT